MSRVQQELSEAQEQLDFMERWLAQEAEARRVGPAPTMSMWPRAMLVTASPLALAYRCARADRPRWRMGRPVAAREQLAVHGSPLQDHQRSAGRTGRPATEDANFVTSARQATGSSGRWFADRTGSALTVPGVATSFVAVPIRADCRASFSSCGSIARFQGETWSWQVHTARPGATSSRSRVTTSVTASAASRSWTCAAGIGHVAADRSGSGTSSRRRAPDGSPLTLRAVFSRGATSVSLASCPADGGDRYRSRSASS